MKTDLTPEVRFETQGLSEREAQLLELLVLLQQQLATVVHVLAKRPELAADLDGSNLTARERQDIAEGTSVIMASYLPDLSWRVEDPQTR